MSFFYRFLIISCFFINFSNASKMEGDYTAGVKAFTQVWEELENYRSWTAARLESLDVNNQWGRVSEERVTDVKSEVPKFSIEVARKVMKNRDPYAYSYCGQVQDRLIDYYISEGLVESMEILFQHSRRREVAEELASRIKNDILGVLDASLVSFVDGANIKMFLGYREDPNFLPLF
ncbi:MAG TPA: hypothetical protein DD412_08630 [Holosporales bacterium]|nr:hypothetical protein [Holosporales bacterium]